jgi:hypothetical protein
MQHSNVSSPHLSRVSGQLNGRAREDHIDDGQVQGQHPKLDLEASLPFQARE